MNNKIEKKEQNSMIKELRKIRDKMSLEIIEMTKKEIKEYFAKKRTLHPTRYVKNSN